MVMATIQGNGSRRAMFSILDLMLTTENTNSQHHANLEVVTTNGVFWDVTPCGSCKNRRFGGT
jgi:hypothetical protein